MKTPIKKNLTGVSSPNILHIATHGYTSKKYKSFNEYRGYFYQTVFHPQVIIIPTYLQHKM